jgi:lipid A 3-O-deacylase
MPLNSQPAAPAHRRARATAGRLSACLLAALALPAPARADSVWLGVYRHDVIIRQARFETGEDIKAGWIGDRLDGLRAIGRPAPHLLVSKSLDGGTDYVAAGLNWTFGSTLYLRPGIGLSLNNGPDYAERKGRRVDLGSRVTFEPELAAGWRITDRVALEASWIHLSHAQLFSRQNRGMDSIGLRAVIRLKP